MTNWPRSIIAIVEGKGELDSVPALLRRVSGELHGRYDFNIPKPVRAKNSGHLIKTFENLLLLARNRECNAILVMRDTDTGSCPREMAVSLSERARNLNLDVPVSIVCPNSEYETWFISTLSELQGRGIRDKLGLHESVVAPANVEEIRGAKEWLSGRMPMGRSYKPTEDQADLTYYIDLKLVQSKSRSFRRLCHAVEELIEAVDNGLATVTPPLGNVT